MHGLSGECAESNTRHAPLRRIGEVCHQAPAVVGEVHLAEDSL
jgi:hypothetical protein